MEDLAQQVSEGNAGFDKWQVVIICVAWVFLHNLQGQAVSQDNYVSRQNPHQTVRVKSWQKTSITHLGVFLMLVCSQMRNNVKG